ncbi:TPA: hypothetical protein ACGJ08_004856, partial [Yersinia enterocolitica]
RDLKMADFTVRVQLHRASAEQYETLHENMAAHGYSKYIVGSNGQKYDLPDAEYVANKAMSVEQVRVQVSGIADAITSGAYVLVSESTSRAWFLHLTD